MNQEAIGYDELSPTFLQEGGVEEETPVVPDDTDDTDDDDEAAEVTEDK